MSHRRIIVWVAASLLLLAVGMYILIALAPLG
jgi:hypothetical protein